MPQVEIKELRSRAKEKTEKFNAIKQKYYANANPQPFKDSTWLYIRSLDGDDGSRPLPSGIFWQSPDVELFSRTGENVDRLETGEEYRVQVTIRNRGDLHAHACTVELYLCDPAIGSAIASPATHFLAMQSTSVSSGGTSIVEFPFTAKPEFAGHKCMFARVHSVLNRELPLNVGLLDAVNDRHDAQQNLTITAVGEIIRISMAMPEMGNNNFMFMVKAAAFSEKIWPQKRFGGLKFLSKKTAEVSEKGFVLLAGKQQEGINYGPNAPLVKITDAIAKQYNLDIKKLPVNQMLARGGEGWNLSFTNKTKGSTFVGHLVVPKINLSKGQAAMFLVYAVDAQKKTPTTIGGFTLMVKG